MQPHCYMTIHCTDVPTIFLTTLTVRHFDYLNLFSIFSKTARNIFGEIFPHIHDTFLTTSYYE